MSSAPILRPFRFLQTFPNLSLPSEAIIIKRMFVPKKPEGDDRLLYGTLARTSGSSGSQIMLANALDLPTEALDISFPMNPLELEIHYTTYLKGTEHSEPIHGKKAEALVHFLKTFKSEIYSRQKLLWVNIGSGCCSYLVDYQ